MLMSEITENRIYSLASRYRERFPEMPIQWCNFARWMINEVRPYVIQASWTAYRHAFNSVCPSEEAKEILRDTQALSRTEKKPCGSRMRRKRYTQEDQRTLERLVLNKRSAKWSKQTGVWLRCALVTGLRPHEWMFAVVENGYLIVENVKLNQTTEKEWFPRVIPVAHLHPNEVKQIKWLVETMRSAKSQAGGYNVIYNGCRKWLSAANKQLWPRRRQAITLMSGRHQFMANLKANGFTALEIAYLVGHGNDIRSYESYCATSYGTIGANLPDTSHISDEDFNNISKKLSSKLSTLDCQEVLFTS